MPPKPKQATSRLGLLYVLIVAVTAVLITRLYQFQIVEGQKYRLMADLNRLRLVEVAAPRGVIYASGGEILARNRPSFTVAVVPADLPKDQQGLPEPEQEAAVLDRLLNLLPQPTPTITPTVQPAPTETQSPSATGPTPTPQPTPTTKPLAKIAERQPWVMPRDQIDLEIADGRLGGAYKSITVAKYITETTAFRIAEDAVNLPGVELQLIPIRDYPDGAFTSHAVGYMGPIPEAQAADYEAEGYGQNDQVGLVGLEYTFENELHGKAGRQTIEVDVNGHKVRTIGQPDPPEPGHNLVLTLDLNLQHVAAQALQEELDSLNDSTHKVTQGVVVALDPRNGGVLAMVSLPSFDNNIFAKGITMDAWQALISDPDLPLINQAISGQYPPGSIFKQIPAAAGLQEGVINVNTRLTDDGGIMYLPNKYFPWDRSQDQPFVCWSRKYGYGHGAITVREALAVSCDIFFYKLGGGYQDFPGLGSETLGYYARQFGLDEPTGIDLPGEAGGLIPDPKWKRLTFKQSWVTGDTYNMSIGQGDVLVTPLQMANVTAAVANRGSLYKPHLVDRITDADGNLLQRFEPALVRQVPVDPENLDIVREGMYGAVNWPQGTAPNARLAGIDVAGKTGTAEFFKDDNHDGQPDLDEKGNMPTHAWFTSFAPYINPEIVVTVFISNGGEGSANAVPVAAKILKAYFEARSEG